MIAFVFRWLLPGFGLGMLAVALLGAPGRGTPPLATLWGERVATTVTAAEIVENDPRHSWRRTEIRVAWPPGGTAEAPVGALSASARAHQRAALETELARFPPGARIMVRTADGQPWADATDGFALAWTIGMALAGAMLAAVGLFLNRALR